MHTFDLFLILIRKSEHVDRDTGIFSCNKTTEELKEIMGEQYNK